MYKLLVFCILIFVVSLFSLQFIEKYSEENNILVKNRNFIIPFTTIFSFFVGCYAISNIINQDNKHEKYYGIYYLIFIAIVFLYVNINFLNKEKMTDYIKGKKYSSFGSILSIGIGALLFGFLDNFGMKLGIEALDDMFILLFLGPFSITNQYKQHQKNIYKNIGIINEWANKDWRRMINQCMRYESEIINNKKLSGLANAIQKFGSKKLDIPESILKDTQSTNEYVDNIRRKYDIIHDSKAMLGNTFSNVIAALLGGAILNIFVYLTIYDDSNTGDKSINQNYFVRNRENFMPLIEMVFIFIGCIIPIFLHIAMEKSEYVSIRSWYVIIFVAILMISMMYISYRNIEPMTYEDKINSIVSNLRFSMKRSDLSTPKEKEIYEKCENFISSLKQQPKITQI
jgi:undecaprenyl pyrophosphate phosphatase UppP